MGSCHDSAAAAETATAATLTATTELLKVMGSLVQPHPALLPSPPRPLSEPDTAEHAPPYDHNHDQHPSDDPLEFTIIDPTVLMSQLAK